MNQKEFSLQFVLETTHIFILNSTSAMYGSIRSKLQSDRSRLICMEPSCFLSGPTRSNIVCPDKSNRRIRTTNKFKALQVQHQKKCECFLETGTATENTWFSKLHPRGVNKDLEILPLDVVSTVVAIIPNVPCLKWVFKPCKTNHCKLEI